MLLITCFILVFLVGCTPEQEEQVKNLVKENRCSAYNGYLCSAPDDCGVPYLDVIESYCCPIPCESCNQSCDDGNGCTEDSCSKNTNYECKYEELIPCPNNGICEKGEFNGNSPHCPGEPYATSASINENTDCPQDCNDNNPDTADSYDFETQQCKHEVCEVAEKVAMKILNSTEEETEEITGLEPPYVISIEDSLGNQCDVIANTRCFSGNRPQIHVGEDLTFTINAEDPTDDKIYYSCYPSSNQGFMDWQTSNVCTWDITIQDYTNFPFFIIFIKDDNNHYFHGGVEADQEVHLYYEVIP